MKRLCMHVDTVELSFKALFFVFFIHFLPFLAVLFLLFSPCLYGFARCCDKRISSLTLKRTNLLRVERLQRRINTTFCSNSVQSNHSGNESLINGCVIGCLPFSMGKPVAPRLYISPRNRIYHSYDSVPFIAKRPRRPETGIKDGLKKWNTGQLYFQDLPIYNKLNISSAKVGEKTATRFRLKYSVRKTGLPFQMFRCFWKFSAGTRTQKVVFHVLFNRIFRNLFLNSKQRLCTFQGG